jgi:hypothetical protein
MGPWTEALSKMNPPEAPSASQPGWGGGNVPYASGIFRGGGAPPPTPQMPSPPPGPVSQPAQPGGAPAGAPPGAPMGQPQPNPMMMQAEILSTLMSAVMASIERAKQRRAGTYTPGNAGN